MLLPSKLNKFMFGGLPLNLATLSCLFLVAERETDMENSQSSYHDRYKRDTFLQDPTELGLPTSIDFNKLLQEIIERGYIDVDSHGWFLAKKPAMSMAQLLDNALGSTSGVNFTAYIIQTVEEVLSGRKELKTALSQFDQKLWIYGEALLKQKSKKALHKKKQEAKEIEKRKQISVQTKQLLQAYRARKQKEESIAKAALKPLSEPKVISPSGKLTQFEAKEIAPKIDVSLGVDEDKGAEPVEQVQEISAKVPGGVPDTDVSSAQIAPSAETPRLSTEHEVSDQRVQEISSKPESEEQDLAQDAASVADEAGEADIRSDQLEEAGSVTATAAETDSVRDELGPSAADQLIEERIAAFEDTLAMSCPICDTGRVKAEQTAKDRFFYKCTNDRCIFISWGKPYHIACPMCNNPFLVETADNPEVITLKCPRATCRYRQNMADGMTDSTQERAGTIPRDDSKSDVSPRKPRKKVVRRRLVRRKR